MDPITQALEGWNLSPVFFTITLGAAVLTVLVMQATSHYRINAADPVWHQNLYRFVLMAIACTFLWMFSFAWDKSWQPWPPLLILVMLYDVLLAARLFIVYSKAAEDERAAKRAAAALLVARIGG